MTPGMTDQDWSAWYRLFSEQRFDYDKASEILFEETLQHVAPDELYVVGGDGTQTPRSSRKMEGSGWLRNLRTPPFMVGIHAAQRWFNGSWLMPAENGYSRALPIHWLPAFTEKSEPVAHAPQKEWEAAVSFCSVVGMGLLALAAGRLPNVGLIGCASCPHSLVARLHTLVTQHPLASIPGGLLGRARFSPALYANTGRPG